MKVGLYFGSFNPIHNGHLILSKHILNINIVDQVWFIVSPHNPLKTYSSLLNEHNRLNMLKLSIEGEINLKASNIEFKLPKPSYTIDTLTYLREIHPSHEFQVIMGTDSYQNIHKWKNAQALLRNHNIILFGRKGFEFPEEKKNLTLLKDSPLIEISSTMIRKLVKERKSIRYLAPDMVVEEIERMNYYKSSLENEA